MKFIINYDNLYCRHSWISYKPIPALKYVLTISSLVFPLTNALLLLSRGVVTHSVMRG
jgi:hypothetical protein